MLDIELNMQFCPKKVGTFVPCNIAGYLFKNKNTRSNDSFGTKKA